MGWRALCLKGVSKTFGGANAEGVPVLKGVSLEIGFGDFYCLLGPSGCGKTTLLNIIAGFERSTAGTVAFDDRLIEGPGTDRAVIFQDVSNALFPWLTVRENVEFGLRMRGVPKAERREKARAYLSLVNLSEDGHKFPFELSGGMKQRAQIARALANDPDVLLMDEPFGALDAITKKILQFELLRIWQETQKTVFYITHDIGEALLLGTHLGVMSAGPEATIIREFAIDLPTPKDPSTPQFLRLVGEVEGLIEAEVHQRIRFHATD